MIWGPTQKIIFAIIVLLCINYLTLVIIDKYAATQTSPEYSEGFEGTIKDGSDTTLYTWITDPVLIYDDFYAGIYDQLTNQIQRTQAKTALLMNLWTKDKTNSNPSTWSILDAGCGTGHAVTTFAKMDVGRIIGLDSSPAMIRYAEKTVVPAAKLKPQQLSNIRWRTDTFKNPSACSAGEFNHIILLYFSFYYIENQEEFFRFANLWMKPGGKLVIEVVNKYKFDPILESASPFVAFSLQKYSKERLLKSKVAFDKFEYEAEFQLSDPKAEFYETFRFKNNHVRRQKHIFHMPTIEAIVRMGKTAGFKYVGYQDLNALGFEYAYLLQFER
jgi:SAM-dependent methyltransferase|uniref:Methyltransferase domain-containing protein n=1 Tax=viral metagenome TaxID=1070528 RepID=A0A6C0HFT7_9ZZZZ